MFSAKTNKMHKMRKDEKLVTHDYRERVWGHDYTLLKFKDSGLVVEAMGWGHSLKAGDYFVIDQKGIGRYKIASIEYMRDPEDMWKATLNWDQFDSKEQMLAEESEWI